MKDQTEYQANQIVNLARTIFQGKINAYFVSDRHCIDVKVQSNLLALPVDDLEAADVAVVRRPVHGGPARPVLELRPRPVLQQRLRALGVVGQGREHQRRPTELVPEKWVS